MSEEIITRGDGKSLVLSLVDPAGEAVNLTDTPEIRFAMARRIGAPTAIEKSLTAGGIEITDAVAGEITVTLDPSDTDVLRPGFYAFEVELTDLDGTPSTAGFNDTQIRVCRDQLRSGT